MSAAIVSTLLGEGFGSHAKARLTVVGDNHTLELHRFSRESYAEGEGVERVKESAVPPRNPHMPLRKALSDLQKRNSLRVKGPGL